MTSRSSFFYYAGTKVLGRSEYASESGLEGRPICVSKLKKGKGNGVSRFLNFKFGFHKIKMSDKI